MGQNHQNYSPKETLEDFALKLQVTHRPTLTSSRVEILLASTHYSEHHGLKTQLDRHQHQQVPFKTIVTKTLCLYRHRNLLHLHPFNFIFLIAREPERKLKIANHNLMSFLGKQHFMYKSTMVILKGKLNSKVSKDNTIRRLQMEGKRRSRNSFKVTNLGMLMFL